ncbi:hypothetical protein DL766_007135 [Monosporascus sp. MC13-8B]|uniref:Pectate lyase n=1 Tax=Monosporascus cannonballus TaxID=155416 RepID=A0ABY0H453_9PEZI|nr:hypothetical protein DL762_006927 [Monosporascus cannonballus]RYO92440.1 hypothetical protein DL763_004667 [Monosporascus cannonballus]RYP25106.1 hypothetical protein DL766_007135 [Monosporascus sp. MC13-8B]
MGKCDCKYVCAKVTQKDKRHCKDCADHYNFAWKHEKANEKCDDTKDGPPPKAPWIPIDQGDNMLPRELGTGEAIRCFPAVNLGPLPGLLSPSGAPPSGAKVGDIGKAGLCNYDNAAIMNTNIVNTIANTKASLIKVVSGVARRRLRFGEDGDWLAFGTCESA